MTPDPSTCPICGRAMVVRSDPGGEGTSYYACPPCDALRERVAMALRAYYGTPTFGAAVEAVIGTLSPELRQLAELERGEGRMLEELEQIVAISDASGLAGGRMTGVEAMMRAHAVHALLPYEARRA